MTHNNRLTNYIPYALANEHADLGRILEEVTGWLGKLAGDIELYLCDTNR